MTTSLAVAFVLYFRKTNVPSIYEWFPRPEKCVVAFI